MAKQKITLVKSSIGYPKNQKATLQALGLRKLNQSKVVDINDATKGMIQTVQHLLKIENEN